MENWGLITYGYSHMFTMLLVCFYW
jgi:hypothetical protein